MTLDPREFEKKPEPSVIDVMKQSKIDREKLKDAIEFAREMGLGSIEVDGIKMEIPPLPEPVPVGDIKQPTTPFDNLSDDEILFWSTPHYDELLAAKEERMKALEEEQNVR